MKKKEKERKKNVSFRRACPSVWGENAGCADSMLTIRHPSAMYMGCMFCVLVVYELTTVEGWGEYVHVRGVCACSMRMYKMYEIITLTVWTGGGRPAKWLYVSYMAAYKKHSINTHILYMLYISVFTRYTSRTTMYSNTIKTYRWLTGHVAGITPQIEVLASPNHTLFLFIYIYIFFFSLFFLFFFWGRLHGVWWGERRGCLLLL